MCIRNSWNFALQILFPYFFNNLNEMYRPARTRMEKGNKLDYFIYYLYVTVAIDTAKNWTNNNRKKVENICNIHVWACIYIVALKLYLGRPCTYVSNFTMTSGPEEWSDESANTIKSCAPRENTNRETCHTLADGYRTHKLNIDFTWITNNILLLLHFFYFVVSA